MADTTDYMAWAKKPPAQRFREHWEKAIVDLVASGDERFRPILSRHIESGVIRSERAIAVLNGVEHEAA